MCVTRAIMSVRRATMYATRANIELFSVIAMCVTRATMSVRRATMDATRANESLFIQAAMSDTCANQSFGQGQVSPVLVFLDHRLSQTAVILTRTELAAAAGISDAELGQLEEYGLVTPAHTSRDRVLFDEDALAIARVAATFMRHGVEPRHLRMYRAFAEREAGLFEQVLLPYRRQRNPEAQARTRDTLGELSGLGRQLRTALLRQAVRRSLMG